MTEFEKAARLMNETGLGEHLCTRPEEGRRPVQARAPTPEDEDSDPPGPWNWADAPTTGFIA